MECTQRSSLPIAFLHLGMSLVAQTIVTVTNALLKFFCDQIL